MSTSLWRNCSPRSWIMISCWLRWILVVKWKSVLITDLHDIKYNCMSFHAYVYEELLSFFIYSRDNTLYFHSFYRSKKTTNVFESRISCWSLYNLVWSWTSWSMKLTDIDDLSLLFFTDKWIMHTWRGTQKDYINNIIRPTSFSIITDSNPLHFAFNM